MEITTRKKDTTIHRRTKTTGINQKGALVKLRKNFWAFRRKKRKSPPFTHKNKFRNVRRKNVRVPPYSLFWELLGGGGYMYPLVPPP